MRPDGGTECSREPKGVPEAEIAPAGTEALSCRLRGAGESGARGFRAGEQGIEGRRDAPDEPCLVDRDFPEDSPLALPPLLLCWFVP